MEMPSNQIAKPLKVYHCGQNYLITLEILILMVKDSPPLPFSMTVCDSVRSSKPLCTSHVCTGKPVSTSHVCTSKLVCTIFVRSNKPVCTSHVRSSKYVCASKVCSSRFVQRCFGSSCY